eukprot:3868462-Heterocapsa_arctica.AAC.1
MPMIAIVARRPLAISSQNLLVLAAGSQQPPGACTEGTCRGSPSWPGGRSRSPRTTTPSWPGGRSRSPRKTCWSSQP